MKIKIFGKNIEVTEGIKGAVEEKLGKLDKYFAEETKADGTLSVNRNDQKVEVTIPVKGGIISGLGNFIAILLSCLIFRNERMTVRKIIGYAPGYIS